ncbi:hypothetical protein Fcan01_23978 [Folsomia candida]|uniref:Uncharacterized protein n=1 Tax=Folsomia candida TaxID=158441 RepID=A0A226DAB5_FOLCA|nr:hypothetical protein Fcan01_23978 [Folsomia candida]
MASIGAILMLLQILSKFFLIGCATAEKPKQSDQAILDLIESKLTEYLYLFENCTTVMFTNTDLTWGSSNKKTKLGPIVLLDYKIHWHSTTRCLMYDQISLHRYRNKAPHCWATFLILPEKLDMFGIRIHYFIEQPLFCLIYPLEYFIFFTAKPKNAEGFLTRNYGQDLYNYVSLREFLIVDATKLGEYESVLRISYLNIYHMKSRPAGVESSEEWYTVVCLPVDCLHNLIILGRNLSRLNKYFWTGNNLFHKDLLNTGDLFAQNKLYQSHHRYRQLANLTSFNRFLSYWILEDLLTYDLSNFTPIYSIPPVYKINWRYSQTGSYYLVYDNEPFSFVSCYQTISNTAMLTSLSSPFDWASWRCLGISCGMVVLILTVVHRKVISDSIYLVVGITIENSVIASQSTYEIRTGKKKYHSVGLYTIIAVWTIFVGTVLTNWYKTCFTMEMIVLEILVHV